MDPYEKRSRADAAQDADATQFVTLESIWDERIWDERIWDERIRDEAPGPRRRGLLLAVALGILVALASLAAVAYTHRGHPAPVRAEAYP